MTINCETNLAIKSFVFSISKQKESEAISRPSVKMRAAKNKNNSLMFSTAVFTHDSNKYSLLVI